MHLKKNYLVILIGDISEQIYRFWSILSVRLAWNTIELSYFHQIFTQPIILEKMKQTMNLEKYSDHL